MLVLVNNFLRTKYKTKKELPLIFAVLASFLLPPPQALSQTPTKATVARGIATPYNVQHLSLTEAVLLAVRNNPSIRNARLQRVVDKFSLEIAHNEFEPQAEFSTAGNYTTGEHPSYLVKPGARLKTFLGTTLSTNYSQDLTHNREKTLALSATQPLLRGVRPSVVLAPLHNAIDQEAINRLTLNARVISTITQTIAAYNTLVQSYNSLQVQELALKESLNLLEEYKIKFKAGSLPRVSITEQQSQVASLRLNIESAKNAVSQARHALLITLGLDPRSRLQIDNALTDFTNQPLTLKQSTQIALAHNINYQQALIALRSRHRAVKVQKDQQLWDVTLSGSVEITEQAQAAKQTHSSATLSLSIPIDDVNRKAGLANAKIALKQAKISLQESRDRLIASVADAVNNLNSQARQLKLAKQKVALASKTYKTASLSHKYGFNSASEVVRQQNTLINARLSLINLQINYINVQANFRALLGQTLADWHITL